MTADWPRYATWHAFGDLVHACLQVPKKIIETESPRWWTTLATNIFPSTVQELSSVTDLRTRAWPIRDKDKPADNISRSKVALECIARSRGQYRTISIWNGVTDRPDHPLAGPPTWRHDDMVHAVSEGQWVDPKGRWWPGDRLTAHWPVITGHLPPDICPFTCPSQNCGHPTLRLGLRLR